MSHNPAFPVQLNGVLTSLDEPIIQRAVQEALLPYQEGMRALVSEVRKERDEWLERERMYGREIAQLQTQLNRLERKIDGLSGTLEAAAPTLPQELFTRAAKLDIPPESADLPVDGELPTTVAVVLRRADLTTIGALLRAIQEPAMRGFNWQKPRGFGRGGAEEVRKALLRLARTDERYRPWAELPQLSGE